MESPLTRFSLTKKQQAVYDFIQRYFVAYRRSPLIREVQHGCQITSYKSAIDRLNTLERKRYIKRIPNKHRGIKLFRPSASLDQPVQPPQPPLQPSVQPAQVPAGLPEAKPVSQTIGADIGADTV